jgi:hypothetical protein
MAGGNCHRPFSPSQQDFVLLLHGVFQLLAGLLEIASHLIDLAFIFLITVTSDPTSELLRLTLGGLDLVLGFIG